MTEILDLPAGATIPGPGAYRTPLEHYHSAAICPGPSISSSGLRTIELESPARYWAFSPLNPNRWPREETKALDFGKAAHALLLGDEDFAEGYAVRPLEWSDWRTKAAQEWRAEQERVGRTVITPEDYQHIANMADALHRHGLPDVIFGGQPEVSLIWQDRTGVWVKARPDALSGTGDLGDLKTTHDASRKAVLREIAERGYDMQMALGIEAMRQVLGVTPPSAVLIFVEKKPPYTVVAAPISEDALYWARCRNRRAIDTFARGIETGEWPGEADFLEYNLPPWLMERLSNEQAEGRLPNLRGDEA